MTEQILVTRSSMPSLDEYVDEIADIFNSHWLTNMGPKHQQLEEELSSFLAVPHVSLFINGHAAIESAIELLELKGEVITTPFTFASTTNAIVRKGLTPVFCDIKPDNLTIDPEKIESLITENTSAIMPVHVYGNLCDVEKINDIASKYNLKVIYDAAHAFGATYKGVSVANYGDLVAYSFHATKVFNTIEGGGLAYKEDALKSRIRALRNFGMQDYEIIEYPGGNTKMNEFCAAMGLCNLRHIDHEIQKRKAVFERYCEHLLPYSDKGVVLPGINQEQIGRNYAYFPVFIDKDICTCTRDDLIQALAHNGVSTRKYFYPLTSAFAYTQKYNPNKTPIAEQYANGILTLPLYSDLALHEVDRICELIKDVLQ